MNIAEIFKNIFLTENLWTTASETYFELARVRVAFVKKVCEVLFVSNHLFHLLM